MSPERPPVPLLSVDIVATVIHAGAHVELTQVYMNKEIDPIEAIYYFPVDANGGVTDFHAELEGRTINGIVKAQKEAKYEKAMKENRTGFLLEKNKPDIFMMQVGFLKPGSQVKVVLRYVSELINEKGSNAIRFFIPNTVAPRYIYPTETYKKSNFFRFRIFRETFSEILPAPLTIAVDIAIQGKIKSIHSPTHQIAIEENKSSFEENNWCRAVVKLTGNVTDMDKDFVLLISPDEVHVPRLYMEKLEKSTALMIHMIPSFNLDQEQKLELIFVLDRSSSMDGASITLAKKALAVFLHSMPSDCYFNIVGFGKEFEFLFPSSVKYDDYSLHKAISHAKALNADLGGTELLKPLTAIFSKELIPGYLRRLFVLTDGHVSNTELVLRTCKENCNNNRLFALGIGDVASVRLVNGMAEAGCGTASFVMYNEPMDSKVLQQLKNAIQPALTHVEIQWIGLQNHPVENISQAEIHEGKTILDYEKTTSPDSINEILQFWQVPEKIPPISDGSQLVVFGIFQGQAPKGIKITAKSPKGPLSFQIDVLDESDIGSNGILHKLAGVKLIQQLEMKEIPFPFYSNDAKRNQAQITNFSLQHGLCSDYTLYLGVDSSTTFEDYLALQTRHVSFQYPQFYAQYQLGRLKARWDALMGTSELFELPQSVKSKHDSIFSTLGNLFSGLRILGKKDILADRLGEVCTAENTGIDFQGADAVEDKLRALISTQSFNGAFPLSEDFSISIDKSLEVLIGESKKFGYTHEAWATALALTHLAKEMRQLKETWELVERKARKWLAQNFTQEMDAILAAAEEFFENT